MSVTENQMLPANSDITLLLVDDEANILSSLRRQLRPHNFNIITAHSGSEALDILQDESVDLIISDMQMPEMDGATLLSSVAQDFPDIIRIILTGQANMAATIKAINTGNIYQYLKKPWNDEDLLLTIRSGLKHRFLQLENQNLLNTIQQQNQELEQLNSLLENRVKSQGEEIQQTSDMLDRAYEELKVSYQSSIPVFVRLFETRPGNKAGDSQKAAVLARTMARACKLSEEQVEEIYLATLLRNIGKIGLSDQLLTTPFSKLDAKNKDILRKHPLTGESALMDLPSMGNISLYIRHQNELFSGKGIPDHLQGHDIPLGSRILSIVSDFFDLQTTKLLPQKLDPYEAILHLDKYSNNFYDPELISIFKATLEKELEEQIHVKEQEIQSHALQNGMILSRDLVGTDDLLLLSKDKVLNQHIIKKLIAYERSKDEALLIYIKLQEDSEEPVLVIDNKGQ